MGNAEMRKSNQTKLRQRQSFKSLIDYLKEENQYGKREKSV